MTKQTSIALHLAVVMRTTASAWSDAEMKEISVDSVAAGDIKAATLEAIARATGWEESK